MLHRRPTSPVRSHLVSPAAMLLIAAAMALLPAAGPIAAARSSAPPAAAPPAGGPASAADAAGSEADASSAELESPDQTVSVDDLPSDRRIELRIRRILAATERFASVDITVDEGVVILSGVADSDVDRTWAADLANRTEGVVAVMNEMSVPVAVTPIWTIEPAKREFRLLWETLIRTLPLLILGLLVLVLFLSIAGTVARIAGRALSYRLDNKLLRGVLEKVAFAIVAIIGVYLFLRISGLTRLAVTLLGGTGVAGLILGFAFRDIAENFLASILISIQKPFRIGDTIEVQGHLGVVHKVTTRGTVLIDFDGNHIQLANATVYKNTIKNFTANPRRRISFDVGIGYDASIAEAQSVALRVLQDHPAVMDDPEPLVLVTRLGAATVDMKLFFWIDGSSYSKGKVQSAVMRRVVRALEQAGVSMPDEAREVVFPAGVPVAMDAERRSGLPAAGVDQAAAAGAAALASEAAREQAEDAAEARQRQADDSRDVATEAEGDLGTEVTDIKEQAELAHDPEAGSDILHEKAPTR